MNESQNPDLDGTACVVTDCTAVSDVIGSAAVTLPAAIGAVEDHLVLDLPLCVHHAHLLRSGVTRCDLDARLT